MIWDKAQMAKESADDENQRLQGLHMALEAALEQLGYAQQIAARGTEIDRPGPEVQAIERLSGELLTLRNRVRDQLMRALARPTLSIIK